jgi:hypothetical protein
MTRYPYRVALMAALCAAIAVPAAGDELEALPDTPGREETYFACIACHSFQLITRQGMSRGMWENTIELMVERHGMFELDPEEEELILDYLVQHFGPDHAPAAGSRRGWTNPFAP